ncbi:MAG: RNA polymerase sigma factor [Bacteroidota bacterium]
MTDQDIVEGCLKKNPKAQKALYDAYAAKMMSVCLRYAGNRNDAQDVLQEGFIKVFEKLDQFSGKGSLGGWVRMIMINTALIKIRKEKKFLHHEEVSEVNDLSPNDHGVLEKLAADEILSLVQNLPAGYRTVFNLYAVEGYSHKEIGEMMGISESTSKTQYFKAKAHLKKALQKLENTP